VFSFFDYRVTLTNKPFVQGMPSGNITSGPATHLGPKAQSRWQSFSAETTQQRQDVYPPWLLHHEVELERQQWLGRSVSRCSAWSRFSTKNLFSLWLNKSNKSVCPWQTLSIFDNYLNISQYFKYLYILAYLWVTKKKVYANDSRAQCYKTFYVPILWMFVIS
jgi:hypothetical protein